MKVDMHILFERSVALTGDYEQALIFSLLNNRETIYYEITEIITRLGSFTLRRAKHY